MNDTKNHSKNEIHQLQQKDQSCLNLNLSTQPIINMPPLIKKKHKHLRRRNAISIPSYYHNELVDRFNGYLLKQNISQKQQEQNKDDDDFNKKILIRMKQLMLSAIDELKDISNKLFSSEQKVHYWQHKCIELQNQMNELTLLQQNTQLKLENTQRKLLESEHIRLNWNKTPIVTCPSNRDSKSSLKKKSSLVTNISRVFHLPS